MLTGIIRDHKRVKSRIVEGEIGQGGAAQNKHTEDVPQHNKHNTTRHARQGRLELDMKLTGHGNSFNWVVEPAIYSLQPTYRHKIMKRMKKYIRAEVKCRESQDDLNQRSGHFICFEAVVPRTFERDIQT